ncbi:MAG: HIG1 domain-containing protein [Alphaproteobacteria bacterium]
MEAALNFIIVICLITTFIILMIGLLHTAKSGDENNNKINLFMRYRVLIQFITLIILTVALFLKS